MLKIVEEIERRLRDYYRMNKEASTSSQSVKMNVHLVCYSSLYCLIVAKTLFCHRSHISQKT